MEVGDHEQSDGGDAEPAKAAVDRHRIRTGIDHHRCPVAVRQDDRVPLTDIAGNHDRVVGRPAAGDPADRNRAHGHRERHHQQHQPQRRPPCRDEHGPDHRRQQHRPGPSGRPGNRPDRHRRPGVRDPHQPPGRPRRQPSQRASTVRPERRHHGGTDSEYRGRCHRRCGQQIGRHRDQAHLSGERGNHRRTRHLRRSRHRQCLGHARAAPRRRAGRPATAAPAGSARRWRAPTARTRCCWPAPDRAATPPRPRPPTPRRPRVFVRSPAPTDRSHPSPPPATRWAMAAPGSRTQPARVPRASHWATAGPAPHRATRSSAPITIATLAPLTATRWVRPVARKSSASAGSRRLVSPSTSPGSRPPGSAGKVAHAACRPARNAPAASCVQSGLSIEAAARSRSTRRQ